MSTHCSNPLGTSELGVPNFPNGGAVLVPSGAKRGVVVLCHGLQVTPGPLPYTLNNAVNQDLLLAQDLQSDGWVVVYPCELGDNQQPNTQNNALVADFTADTNHGTRFLNNVMDWWDHAILWINANYGNWPVVCFGTSLGGWHALSVAAHRTSSITAYGAQVPAFLLWTIDFFGEWQANPKVSYTLASSANGLTLPQASVQVNEVITTAAAPPASLVVATSGGTQQVITYTGVNTGTKTFLGVTGGDATATMATNGAVTQSGFTAGADLAYTALNALGNGQQNSPPLGFIGWETGDEVVGYSNAQLLYNTAHGASAPVTSYSSNAGHGLNSAAVTAVMAWFTASVDPLCPQNH